MLRMFSSTTWEMVQIQIKLKVRNYRNPFDFLLIKKKGVLVLRLNKVELIYLDQCGVKDSPLPL
jgi:hypothetical protein